MASIESDCKGQDPGDETSPLDTHHLNVVEPTAADFCGLAEDEHCEVCLVKWLERREAAAQGFSESPGQYGRLVIPITGVDGDHQRRAIRRRLRKSGVSARLPRNGHALEVRFERGRCSLHELSNILAGIPITLDLAQASVMWLEKDESPEDDGPSAHRAKDWCVVGMRAIRSHPNIALVLLGGLFLLLGAILHWTGRPPVIWLPLLGISAVLCSTQTIVDAFGVLRRFRLDVDVLMFVAAIGAAVVGAYEEGAFLLFLFGLGAAGEELALHRARSAVEALSKLAPDTAELIDAKGETRVMPVEEVAIGSAIAVRPFDRFPMDGVIAHGKTAIDQSPVTGESIPIDKAEGDEVFAGTINGEGQIVVQVTKLSGESTLAQVMRMVEEAQAAQSNTQRFTERVERWYVPAVMVATVLLFVLPPLLAGSAWETWFYRSMAFLIAASPCALAIGTPAATLCGLARSARLGVLIKGGLYLEMLGRVHSVVFDKTGTLTVGRPVVVEQIRFDGGDEDQLLRWAAAVESKVNHPLADAIVSRANHLNLPEADEVRQIAGIGAEGRVEGALITVGRANDRDDNRLLAISERGCTTVVVSRDGEAIGAIGLLDEPRTEAAEAIRRLRALGITRVSMFTGDHRPAAESVATRLGLQDVQADLLPEDKLALIEQVGASDGPVAMVGDGVNDAPALARADVGIAMGAAGTDAAMETADIVLMGNDLRTLVDAILLSRSSRRLIMQNLIIALGVISIVSPLAALGLAQLGLAVILHEGSTIVVVLNSLRLLRWRPRTITA
ncbi:MAG: cation-translocating P-type ATPase [Planctomycetota bacterium]|nr:cation-translocating P-type ATPase [Planctomycetota bacterium]